MEFPDDFYIFLLRWVLVFAFVFAVNSGLARRNLIVYVCHYALFGIMAVLWASGIGGAVAMAMLYAVAFNLFRELKRVRITLLLSREGEQGFSCAGFLQSGDAFLRGNLLD